MPPKRRPRAPKPPEPRAPRRFRVLDVLTRRMLLQDGSVRETLELLGGIEHMNDVNVSVTSRSPREGSGARDRIGLGERPIVTPPPAPIVIEWNFGR